MSLIVVCMCVCVVSGSARLIMCSHQAFVMLMPFCRLITQRPVLSQQRLLSHACTAPFTMSIPLMLLLNGQHAVYESRVYITASPWWFARCLCLGFVEPPQDVMR